MRLISGPLLTACLVLSSVSLGAAAQDMPQQRGQSPVRLKTDVKRGELIARLERVIPQLMEAGDVPGLSVAVIRDSKILWQRGFGVTSAETKEAVSDSTVFEAASLTKPVFAYAVLKLVESGKLALDTPLVKYLPGDYVEGDKRLNIITARMVLSHSTGFPNWRPRGGPLRIHFTPGERFSYSGEGFVYLQRVVEHLTGQPLEEYVRKNVIEPLRMSSSSFVWEERYEVLKATGHNSAGVPTEKRRPAQSNAAASLHTTAHDYAKFVLAIIDGTGLRKRTVEEMLRPQIKVDEGCRNCVENRPTGRLSPSLSWGLGWGLQQTADGLSFWHWGDNNGDVQCYVVAFPKLKTGIVVFTNSGNGHSIIPEVISQAIGGTHPALAWIDYEPYDSPAKKLFKEILAKGAVAVSEYRERRKSPSAPIILNEAQVNRLGYWLIGKKRLEEAIEIFRMNVEDYPSSSNVYDSLGEAYMIKGDKELAIQNYQKSVELNPDNANGIQVLKKLREK